MQPGGELPGRPGPGPGPRSRDPRSRATEPRARSSELNDARDPEAAGSEAPSVRRLPYAVAAYVFVGLAFVGVVVPGLPTFPFLLLAAWAAARGSRRLHDWLYEHPRFGAALIEWEEERAVSRRSKIVAVALMALSWVIILWRTDSPWVPITLAALFLVVGTWLVRRPEPSGHP